MVVFFADKSSDDREFIPFGGHWAMILWFRFSDDPSGTYSSRGGHCGMDNFSYAGSWRVLRSCWFWPLILEPVFCSLRVVECDQVYEGHLVDALALRGDEGRDRLR